jgi:ABC-type transporter Mla maintaining outer membrane lipid asymmetry permease subunit MlaE
MFAADSFSTGSNIKQQLIDFVIHLIPSFILLAILIVAWKWELIGGIILSVFSLGISPFIFLSNYHNNHSLRLSFIIILIITFPFFVAGVLFILSHVVKYKHNQQRKI